MKFKLEQELINLKQGDHACSIYENAAEQLAVAVPFIVDGLSRGERCIYITDDRTVEEVAQALAAAGVDVERQRQRGALRLLTRQDTYIPDDEFVPQAMLDFVRRAQAEALADGFSGLRLTGEMTWALLPEPGCDQLIEYEALLNQLPTNSKSVILCQYNRSRLDAHCIYDAIRTHRLAIVGDQVCSNPYYELPEMVLSKNQAVTTSQVKAKRVDWWIAQLKRARTTEQERERALEKLKRSERRLAEAQRVAHIGSWERDLRTNEVIWSDELYRLFGLTPHDISLSYQQFLDLVVPQDADRIRALVDQTIRDRSPFNFDYRITRPDGGVRVLNDRGAVILNEQGEPIRLVGTAQDVTELRHAAEAQQELIRQKAILQTIFDHIPVMINFIDATGRVQMINREWERVLGWSLEEAQSRDVMAECYPDPESHARVMEYIRNPPPEWTDFKTRVRDGRTLDTSWALIVLPDGTRIGIGQDMTERRAAERALRQSEERLNLAVHAADLGIFEYDHQTHHFYCSPTTRAIFGFGAEEAASLQAYFGLIHHEDRERIVTAIHRAHDPAGAGVFAVEHRLVRPDGGMRWVDVSSRTLFEGVGDARRPLRTVGVVADITDRKRAEQTLREFADRLQTVSRRLLEVQEEERSHLARELHDQFGQILTAISLHLQSARRHAGEAALPRLDECAAMLKQAEDQVRSLALELHPAMLDTLGLEPTLRWLAEQHQKQTGSDVQVVGHVSGESLSPETVLVCFRIVQEAMTNILRHASARQVWIELTQSESALELVVRDDGVGFDVVRTQEQAARRGSLGVRGMRQRVEILGGALQVESEPGRGTRIRATFPLSGMEPGGNETGT